MDVEDPAREGRQEGRPDEAHEAGQDDGVGPCGGDGRRQHGVAGGAGRGLAGAEVRDHGRLEPGLLGPGDRRAGAVGEDEGDLGVERAAGDPRRRAPAGCCRSRRPRPRSARPSAHLLVASPAGRRDRDHLADHDARDPLPRRRRERRGPRDAGGTARTIPRPPLNVARSSASSSPPSAPSRRMTDGIVQRAGIEARRQPVGDDPRHVARQAAAGHVGDAVEVVPAAPRRPGGRPDRGPDRQHRAGVDAGRLEEDLRQRQVGQPLLGRLAGGVAPEDRRVRAPRGPGRLRPPGAGRARSRCCGGPTTAGRRRTSPAATARPSRRSSRSTTPTQVAARSRSSGRMTPGCSAVSPPSRAQPASRQPAATPATTVATSSGHEPPDRHVVEQEERLGAGAGDVVGAHRDEVDPEARRGARHVAPAPPSSRRRRWTPRGPGGDSPPGSRSHPAKPPRPPTTSGRRVDATASRISATARSPAATSTPAAR